MWRIGVCLVVILEGSCKVEMISWCLKPLSRSGINTAICKAKKFCHTVRPEGNLNKSSTQIPGDILAAAIRLSASRPTDCFGLEWDRWFWIELGKIGIDQVVPGKRMWREENNSELSLISRRVIFCAEFVKEQVLWAKPLIRRLQLEEAELMVEISLGKTGTGGYFDQGFIPKMTPSMVNAYRLLKKLVLPLWYTLNVMEIQPQGCPES
ncbi:hypothetical protein NDU88_003692 [Pleurodeles waltl]|uniref:Uncharacterized protein n=1 Tax=Pleurodeles waltl TaxID=8319 RepID=A0AAV7KYS9_PLEWA|nr:hypothetical protein NDU88_003692 [Pleurodeles waltl]